jgi:hypothetical protein
MQQRLAFRPGAAEFPHGNPRLDFCVMWVVEVEPPPDETAAAPAEAEPSPTSAEAMPPESRAVPAPAETMPAETPAPAAEMPPVESPAAPAVTNETVSTFLRAAVEVATAHGGGEQAGQLELLLGDRPAETRVVPAHAFSERASIALMEGKILERTEEGWLETSDFARQRDTWLGALRGDAQDLSCCGESTLDTFTANVVSRFLASPDKRELVRRDLRRRGVAAFGML